MFLKEHLKTFDNISVREENIVSFFQPYFHKKIETVLDPTLLLDKKSYETLNLRNVFESEPYLFVFQVVKNKQATLIGKKIAQKKRTQSN